MGRLGLLERLTHWDARLFARAAAVTLLALGLAWLVTAATDEGGVPWGERIGRTLPLTPACAAIGVWVALAPATARGESKALAALGRSRLQVAGAAVAGAALACVAASLVLVAAPHVGAKGFFPTAPRADEWRWDGSAFVDRARGVFVGPDGAPDVVTSPAPDGAGAHVSMPPHARGAAALALVMAGLAMPLLVAHTMLTRPAARRVGRDDGKAVLAAGASVAASIFLFQAAAAREGPALLGALPPAMLLVFALQRYRAAP